MSKPFWRVAACAAVLAGPAAATTLYAKPGSTSAEVEVADKLCAEQARAAPVRRVSRSAQYIAPAVVGGPIGLGTAALLGGMQEGVHQGREIQRRQAACMRTRGFGRVTLTEQEDADYAKAGEKGRSEWTSRFMSGAIGDRVTAALTPAVPPLPKLKPEPFAIGGLRLEATTVTPASSVVSANGVLASGRAVHRQVATAATGIVKTISFGKIEIEPGAEFFAVDYSSASDPEMERSAVWCGTMQASGVVGRHSPTHCLVSEFTGYRLLLQDDYTGPYAKRKTWLTGPMSQGPGNFLITQGVLRLEPRADDSFGEMDWKLTMSKLGKADVTVVASAQKDGESVDVWHGTLSLDAEGRAVLPFWTHRLTLTRQGGDAVQVAYTPDGDGRGWLDPAPAVAPEPTKPAGAT